MTKSAWVGIFVAVDFKAEFFAPAPGPGDLPLRSDRLDMPGVT